MNYETTNTMLNLMMSRAIEIDGHFMVIDANRKERELLDDCIAPVGMLKARRILLDEFSKKKLNVSTTFLGVNAWSVKGLGEYAIRNGLKKTGDLAVHARKTQGVLVKIKDECNKVFVGMGLA